MKGPFAEGLQLPMVLCSKPGVGQKASVEMKGPSTRISPQWLNELRRL